MTDKKLPNIMFKKIILRMGNNIILQNILKFESYSIKTKELQKSIEKYN